MSNKDVRTPPKGAHEQPENVSATAAMMMLRSVVYILENAIRILRPFQQKVVRANGQKNILALLNEIVCNTHQVILGQLDEFGLMQLFDPDGPKPADEEPEGENYEGPKIVE